MMTTAIRSVLMLALLCLATTVFDSCRKHDSDDGEGPYTERILYSESFDSWGNWNTTPDTMFDPDETLVGIDDGMLKLTINPMTYGGGWVGCELEAPDIQEDSVLSRLGFRIYLDSGYFQERSRINAPGFMNQSTLRLLYNDVMLRMPHPYYDGVSPDSVFHPDEYRIEGKLFELISDNGTRLYRVDGVDHSLSEVNFYVNGISNYPLNISFVLGHANELDPRIDHLFIDKIEIFTWTGERPH